MNVLERFSVSIDSVPESDYLTLSPEPTEEEKRSPYYVYYQRGPADIPREQMRTLMPDSPMKLSDAFAPENIARRMTGSDVNVHLSGYCTLPDGVAFGAAWCDMSEITPEMEAYFDENWMPEGDMFYKVWYPGAHIRHYSDGSVECLGREPELLRLGPTPPLKAMGFSEDVSEKDPDFIGVFGGNTQLMKITDRAGKEKLDILLLHFQRKNGKGKIICTRFWMGAHIDTHTGKIVRTLPFYASVPEEMARLLCIHCATEFATNARNIFDFWKENHR